MRATFRFSLLVLTLLLPAAGVAVAEETLGIVTGPRAGTYIAIGRDIADIGGEAGVKIDVKSSDGSIDNIRRIVSHENAALGIVQSDVLGFMARSRNQETLKMADKLRMVLPLYHEEVHILATHGIKSFKDLARARVVVGEDGSGHMLTAVNLLAISDVTPQQLLKKQPAEGIALLLEEEADAMIFVGGKPVKLFKNLEAVRQDKTSPYHSRAQGLHFLPLKDPVLLKEYLPATLSSSDYTLVKEDIPTIAVTAVLVTYDFSGDSKMVKQRCEQIGDLAAELRKKLPELKADGHPKWREVSFTAPPPIWKRDECAWENAAPEATPLGDSPNTKLGKELIGVIQKK